MFIRRPTWSLNWWEHWWWWHVERGEVCTTYYFARFVLCIEKKPKKLKE